MIKILMEFLTTKIFFLMTQMNGKILTKMALEIMKMMMMIMTDIMIQMIYSLKIMKNIMILI